MVQIFGPLLLELDVFQESIIGFKELLAQFSVFLYKATPSVSSCYKVGHNVLNCILTLMIYSPKKLV